MLEGEGLRANIIEKDKLEEIIRSYFESEWWPNDKAMCRHGAGEMIRVLEQRNYLVCQQGAELFGFIHRTFLEYLCASQILWRIEKDRDLSVQDMCELYVIPHCEDDSWREVIGLLASQLQPRDAVTLVEALLRHPIRRWRRTADEAAPSLTLAIGCIGERRSSRSATFRSGKGGSGRVRSRRTRPGGARDSKPCTWSTFPKRPRHSGAVDGSCCQGSSRTSAPRSKFSA